MAGRASSTGRRAASSSGRTASSGRSASRTSTSTRTRVPLNGRASGIREPWPARRPARRSTARRRRTGAGLGPLDVLGKILVGLWMALAHSIGWLVRVAGRQAATARDLDPEHRRDGAGLLAFAAALLLTVAIWFRSGGVVGTAVNTAGRFLFGSAAIVLPVIFGLGAYRLMRVQTEEQRGAPRPWRGRLDRHPDRRQLASSTCRCAAAARTPTRGSRAGCWAGCPVRRWRTRSARWVAVPVLVMLSIFGAPGHHGHPDQPDSAPDPPAEKPVPGPVGDGRGRDRRDRR